MKNNFSIGFHLVEHEINIARVKYPILRVHSQCFSNSVCQFSFIHGLYRDNNLTSLFSLVKCLIKRTTDNFHTKIHHLKIQLMLIINH